RQTGDAYVETEIEEHFAPRTTSRFIRLTRPNASVLYESSAPENGAFDPKDVPASQLDAPPWTTERLRNGRRLLVHSLPFANRGGERYLRQTGASFEPVERVLDGLLLSLGIAFPLILAAAAGGGYLLMRNSLKPLDRIATAAEQITSRNLNERLPVASTGDEL